MSEVNYIKCPQCDKPTNAVDDGWHTERKRHVCPHCGCGFRVSADSAFDGESSYPVLEIEIVDEKQERIIELTFEKDNLAAALSAEREEAQT